MNAITTRRYQPDDKERCRGLWRELTEWHRQIYQDPNIGGAHPEDYFDRHLEKHGAHNLWVALLDSEIIGLVGLIVDEMEAEIEPLIVSQPHRKKGVGRELTQIAIDEARKLGVRFLSVKPVARNRGAIRFFHHQGFTNVGHIQLFMPLQDHPWKKGLRLFDREFNF